jgi:hypothetical protein
LSESSAGSPENRKRKVWKIVVPIVVVAVLTPLLLYAYAYFTVEGAYSDSWDTINFAELDDDLDLWETDFTGEMTIHNPTGTDIRFVSVKVDVLIDGNNGMTIRDTEVYLPAGGSATIPCTYLIDSQILDSVSGPYYYRTTSVENVVSANVLFIPITRTFSYDYTEVIH